MIISYPTRTWAEGRVRIRVLWRNAPFSERIRQVVASGSVHVIRHMTLAGVSAIGLAPTKGLSGGRYFLWVNAKNYLPVRFEQVVVRPVSGLPVGLTITTNFRFLLPTRANLALIHAVRPAGPGWRRETLITFGRRPLTLAPGTRSGLESLGIFHMLVGVGTSMYLP